MQGLAASGSWGCFDEFNRLIPAVLSVCSVQFKAVVDAIKSNAKSFILQGDEISLDPTCGVFITVRRTKKEPKKERKMMHIPKDEGNITKQTKRREGARILRDRQTPFHRKVHDTTQRVGGGEDGASESAVGIDRLARSRTLKAPD